MTHFGERKHFWAVLDEERGSLVGAAFPLNLAPVSTMLFRTRKEAVAWRNLHTPGLRAVKVSVNYERLL